MSDDDTNTTHTPTRREYVKYDSAVLTGGVFEGVLGQTIELDGYGAGDPFEFLDEPTELVDDWLDTAVDHHRQSPVFE